MSIYWYITVYFRNYIRKSLCKYLKIHEWIGPLGNSIHIPPPYDWIHCRWCGEGIDDTYLSGKRKNPRLYDSSKYVD